MINFKSKAFLFKCNKKINKNVKFNFYYLHHQGMPTVQFPFSLIIHPYRLLPLLGPLNSIQCPHKANECKFLIVSQHC